MKKLCIFSVLAILIQTLHSDTVYGTDCPMYKNGLKYAFVQEIIDQVSTDSITATIQRLQNFGTRYVYTDSCDKAGEYLYRLLEKWGLEVEYDCFEGERLNDFWFDSTGQYGWACGDIGTVCKTTDWGNHWEIFDLDLIIDLKGVEAVNRDSIWIVGVGTVIHTGNGGETWTISSDPDPFPDRWDEVQFIDARHGWIVDVEGESILHTSDGGKTWTAQGNVTDQYQRYSDICFVDTLNGWTATRGGVLKTANGGKYWILVTVEEMRPFYSIHFINKNNGWIVGEKGRIYRSSDGGIHWNRLTPPEYFDLDLYAVYFIDNSEGWIAGQLGTLLHTVNGGESWSAIRDVTIDNLSEVFFIDSDKGWITGQGGTILYTENGGTTWTPLQTGIPFKPWCNVIARIPGVSNPDKKFIISGHYDSIARKSYWGDPYHPAPGADDNASGISAVLEAARILKNYNLACTVELICFTAEELGLIGSSHYAYEQVLQNVNIAGVLNFDVIGTNSANNEVDIYCGENSDPISDVLSETMTLYTNLEPNPIDDDGKDRSDGNAFSNLGFPSVNVFQGGLPPNIHTSSDLLSSLDLDFLTQVVQAGVASLALLADEVGTDIREAQHRTRLPETAQLSRNFPNPFNQNTAIQFSLPKAGQVKLLVFDLLGKEIQILMDESRNPGKHTVKWNAQGLPGDIYLYRLETKGRTETGKLILQK